MAKRNRDGTMDDDDVQMSEVSSSKSPPKKKSTNTKQKKEAKKRTNTTPMALLNKHVLKFNKLLIELKAVVKQVKMKKDQNKQFDEIKKVVSQFEEAILESNVETAEMMKVMLEKEKEPNEPPKEKATPKMIAKTIVKEMENERALVITGVDFDMTSIDKQNLAVMIIQETGVKAEIESIQHMGRSKAMKVVMKNKDATIQVLRTKFRAQQRLDERKLKLTKYMNEEERVKKAEMTNMITKMKENNDQLDLVVFRNRICRRKTTGPPEALTKDEMDNLLSSQM